MTCWLHCMTCRDFFKTLVLRKHFTFFLTPLKLQHMPKASVGESAWVCNIKFLTKAASRMLVLFLSELLNCWSNKNGVLKHAMCVITEFVGAAVAVCRRHVGSEPRWRPPKWTCRCGGSQQTQGHGCPRQSDRQLRRRTNQSGNRSRQTPTPEIAWGCLIFFALCWYHNACAENFCCRNIFVWILS